MTRLDKITNRTIDLIRGMKEIMKYRNYETNFCDLRRTPQK